MPYDFSNVSVLIVEDNQPLAAITRSILETFGVKTIHAATNGEEGFAKFREHNHDIIIADWMMKPVNGIELTRRLRHDPLSPNPFVPIILMTGYAERDKVVEARDCGVTEFLAKPFTAQDLYKRLAQIIERPRQFIKNDVFFGPDRRRKQIEDFSGPDRRTNTKEQ